jgi:hypothetical protein
MIFPQFILSRMIPSEEAYRAIRLTQEHSFVPIPYVSRLGQRRRCLHSAVKFNSRDLRTHEPECKPILKFALVISDGGKWRCRRKKDGGKCCVDPKHCFRLNFQKDSIQSVRWISVFKENRHISL